MKSLLALETQTMENWKPLVSCICEWDAPMDGTWTRWMQISAGMVNKGMQKRVRTSLEQATSMGTVWVKSWSPQT